MIPPPAGKRWQLFFREKEFFKLSDLHVNYYLYDVIKNLG